MKTKQFEVEVQKLLHCSSKVIVQAEDAHAAEWIVRGRIEKRQLRTVDVTWTEPGYLDLSFEVSGNTVECTPPPSLVICTKAAKGECESPACEHRIPHPIQHACNNFGYSCDRYGRRFACRPVKNVERNLCPPVIKDAPFETGDIVYLNEAQLAKNGDAGIKVSPLLAYRICSCFHSINCGSGWICVVKLDKARSRKLYTMDSSWWILADDAVR